MKVIYLKITSTEKADTDRIINIIGDALEFTGEDLFDTITEIQIPTDEEICQYREFYIPIELEDGFLEGANYVKSKLT